MTERELLPAAQAGVGVVGLRATELSSLPLRDGLVVWDDPQDADEVIQAVYILPHHGGIVLVVTDRNLYVVDAARFAACCEDLDCVNRPM